MNRIQNKDHRIGTYEINKISYKQKRFSYKQKNYEELSQ